MIMRLTANAAAAQTRHQIKRWVRRQFWDRATGKRNDILQEVIDYIDGMAKRSSRKKGGFGKR